MRALWLCLVLVLAGCAEGYERPAAQAGQIDLDGWDFASRGSVELRGEWEVYYARLLEPGDFRTGEPPRSDGYAVLPGFWDGDRVGGSGFGADGVATYRLTLLGSAASQSLALRLQETAGAYRLWVDDRMVAARGVVSATAAESRPGFGAQIAPVRLDSAPHSVLLQVSNHEHLRGGPVFAVLLGDEAQVRGRWRWLRYLDLMLFGALLVLGLYYIGLAAARRDDRAPAAIALMALTWGPRALLWGVGGRALSELAPEAPWWLYTAGDLVLCQWGVAAILFYVTCAVRLDRPERYRRIIFWATAALSVAVVIGSWSVGGVVLLLWEVGCLAAIVWAVAAIARALHRREQGALPVFVGVCLLAVGGLHDILTDLGLLSVAHPAAMPIAVAAFVVTQSLADAYRSHAGAVAVARLSDGLRRRRDEVPGGTPIERTPKSLGKSPPSSGSQFSLRKEHVLLVEVDRAELSRMRAALEECGARVSEATSTRAAQERLAAEHVGLVVVSTRLGRMSLLGFLEQLRRERAVSALPVILLTPRDEELDHAEAFNLGASDYVGAPIMPDEFVARVHLHVTLRQAYAEMASKLSLEIELDRQRRRESSARLEAERASLETLRYQLNPHLLFNVLASIRGAIATDPRVARQMISNLAEFFRLSLRFGAADTIGLEDEFDLLRSFAEIERARYAGELEVSFEVDEATRQFHVPVLVLQPLLENAIEHGTKDAQDPLQVRLQARGRRGGGVQVTVSNTGSWRPEDPNRSQGGVGLANVRDRLGRFYAGRSDLEIEMADGWVHVRVTFPPLDATWPAASSGSSPAAAQTPGR